MSKLEVPESHAELVDAPLTGVLTTLNPDGQPQSTAVWYLVDDDGVLKTSVVTSRQKYKNLQRDPKATLFVLDPANPYRALEVRAGIELQADPDKSMLPKFAARYRTPVEVLDLPDSERVTVVFHPSRVVATG